MASTAHVGTRRRDMIASISVAPAPCRRPRLRRQSRCRLRSRPVCVVGGHPIVDDAAGDRARHHSAARIPLVGEPGRENGEVIRAKGAPPLSRVRRPVVGREAMTANSDRACPTSTGSPPVSGGALWIGRAHRPGWIRLENVAQQTHPRCLAPQNCLERRYGCCFTSRAEQRYRPRQLVYPLRQDRQSASLPCRATVPSLPANRFRQESGRYWLRPVDRIPHKLRACR
jgi:hypothetical protein